MSEPNFGFDEIAANQEEKHATHNIALRQISGRLGRVVSRTTSAQPGSVTDGAAYILPAAPSGAAWTGQGGKLAQGYNGVWNFWTITEGATAWVNDEDIRISYNGTAWLEETKRPMLTKSVAGGSTVTLTEAESRAWAMDLTGTITANIAVVVTTTPKPILVKNSTAGAFTVTVKTASGTGVIVSQGTRALLYCDGTNVVAIAGTAGNPTGDQKDSVRAATTANITLSGAQTIDSVSVVAGDRVLVKNQTSGAENGIYVAAAGSWTRATDADTSDKVTANMYTVVSEGSTNADTLWQLTTNDPITLGSTALVFAQISGSGGSSQPFTDSSAHIKNASDPTKEGRFDASTINTGTTRVYTLPNQNGTLALTTDIAGGGNGDDSLGHNAALDNGLYYGYYGGNVRSDNVITVVAAGQVLLTEGSTNYVEVDSSGVVTANTSGFTSGKFPMATVTTAGGSPSGVGVVTDKRAWINPGSGSALTSAKYQRTAGNYTTTSTTFVDVDATNLALTITTGARKVMIGLSAGATHNTNATNLFLDVAVDGTRQGSATTGLAYLTVSTAGHTYNPSFTYLSNTLTAGSHTFKLQWCTNAGQATLYGGTTAPALPLTFWVQEIG